MDDRTLEIIIKLRDEASKALDAFDAQLDGTGKTATAAQKKHKELQAAWGSYATIAVAAGGALYGVVGGLDASVQSANFLQSSLAGLRSIARAFNEDANAATRAAQGLANDGLMTVGDAATGLKNLLASGFSLDQAVTLMNRFKDSAAFGRQGALNFGEAIRGATEGIKNGNSILVDNAGVTKNLSVILEEAGYSQQDVMRATTDAGVRMALYNGILKETNPMVGDAATLAGQFAGEQAKAGAQIEVLKQQIGTALQPVLLQLMQAITPVITAVSNWVAANPQLAAALAIAVVAFLGLAAAIGAVGAAVLLIGPLVAVVGGPVLAAILAIGAAVGLVAGLVIAYWTPISGFFVNLWSGIVAVATTVFNWIAEKVMWFKNNWVEALGFVIGFFATLPFKLPIFVVQAVVAIINYLRSIDWGAVFMTIGNAFAGIMSRLQGWALDAFNRLRSIDWGSVISGALKGIGNGIIALIEGAINGALAGIPGSPKIKIPRFEHGVRNFEGGLAVVGDVAGRGGELLNLPRGTDVYSNRESKQMLGGMQRSVVIHQTNYNYTQYDREMADREMGYRLAHA